MQRSQVRTTLEVRAGSGVLGRQDGPSQAPEGALFGGAVAAGDPVVPDSATRDGSLADRTTLPAAAHWPAVLMLVLTQWAVGVLVVERVLTIGFAVTFEDWLWESSRGTMALLAAVLGTAGWVAGQLDRTRIRDRHRTGWPSCEAIAFTLFLILTGTYAAFSRYGAMWHIPDSVTDLCGWLAASTGLVTIVASAMIYVSTHRQTCSARRVFVDFGCSTLLLALTSGVIAVDATRIQVIDLRSSAIATVLACVFLDAIAIISSTRLFTRRRALRRVASASGPSAEAAASSPEVRMAELLTGKLAWVSKARTILGVVSAITFTVVVSSQSRLSDAMMTEAFMRTQLTLLTAIVLLRLSSEILERYVFFVTASVPPPSRVSFSD